MSGNLVEVTIWSVAICVVGEMSCNGCYCIRCICLVRRYLTYIPQSSNNNNVVVCIVE